MLPVEPLGQIKQGKKMIFGKDQKEYIPLPALVDPTGLVMTEWELTEDERERLFMGGRVRLWLHHTGVHLPGAKMIPISLEAVERVE